MSGRSSAVKEEPTRVGSPLSLLGAVGGAEGGTGQDDHIVNPVFWSPTVSPPTATIADGAC